MANDAESRIRRDRGTPLSLKLAMVAKPSGMSAVTWPMARMSARLNDTAEPTPIIRPSLNRSTATAA